MLDMLSYFGDNDNSIITVINNTIDTNRLTTNDDDEGASSEANKAEFEKIEISDSYIINTNNTTTTTPLKDVDDDDNNSLITTKIWIENCTSPLNNIHLDEPRVLGGLVPLGIICLVVIVGNMMVMSAVKMTHKLRGATYLFIVSLAWADLMLGLVVLPFSAMYEIFSIWIFGKVWCSIWLAVDVWMCTASIFHLVVISLDRYIAVTHPITYPNLMTSKRAKMLIAGAWILSFVVCFPPLVGWNDRLPSSSQQHYQKILSGDFVNGTSGVFFLNLKNSVFNNHSDYVVGNKPEIAIGDDIQNVSYSSTTADKKYTGADYSEFHNYYNYGNGEWRAEKEFVDYEFQAILDRCQPKCTLTQEPGYVIYSAVGSFYAPMLVMMFFNWRIYRTATKTTKAIRKGWTKVKGVGGNGNSGQVGMGIHRGGPSRNSRNKYTQPKGSDRTTNSNSGLRKKSQSLLQPTLRTNNSIKEITSRRTSSFTLSSCNPSIKTTTSKMSVKNRTEHIKNTSDDGSNTKEQTALLLPKTNSDETGKIKTKASYSATASGTLSSHDEETNEGKPSFNKSKVCENTYTKSKRCSSSDSDKCSGKSSNTLKVLKPQSLTAPTKLQLSANSHNKLCLSTSISDSSDLCSLSMHYTTKTGKTTAVATATVGGENNHFLHRGASTSNENNTDNYRSRSLICIPNITNIERRPHDPVAFPLMPIFKMPPKNTKSISSRTAPLRQVESPIDILNGDSEHCNPDAISADIITMEHNLKLSNNHFESQKIYDIPNDVPMPNCIYYNPSHKHSTSKNGSTDDSRVTRSTCTGSKCSSSYVAGNNKRHYHKKFSEQGTQTDPKNNSKFETEGNNTQNKWNVQTPMTTSQPTFEILNNRQNGNGNKCYKFQLKKKPFKVKKQVSNKKSQPQHLQSAQEEEEEEGYENNLSNRETFKQDKNSQNENNDTINHISPLNTKAVKLHNDEIIDNVCNRTALDEVEKITDNDSINSKTGSGGGSKSYSCFKCHPRRWAMRKRICGSCCWPDIRNKKTFKGNNKSSRLKHGNFSGGSSTADISNKIKRDEDGGDLMPPYHGSAEDVLDDDEQIIPLTGVAAMISAVVNQTVNITAAATGPTATSQGVIASRSSHFGKRNIKSQVRRFRMETKAAKTLGIIVGCFICCWFPFFTIYLIAAFCSDCIPELVFDIFFWLGYCNSALNPFIYAMFSREFRGAFKRILCRLFCMRYNDNVPKRAVLAALNPRALDFAMGIAPTTSMGHSDGGMRQVASSGAGVTISS